MSKFYDAVMGFVVGDALGVPVEFSERDTFYIEDMEGWGYQSVPAGTWSDGSSMILATVDSIVMKREAAFNLITVLNVVFQAAKTKHRINIMMTGRKKEGCDYNE